MINEKRLMLDLVKICGSDPTIITKDGDEICLQGVIEAQPKKFIWHSNNQSYPVSSGLYFVTVELSNGKRFVDVDTFDDETGTWGLYQDSDIVAWQSQYVPDVYYGV